MILFHNIVQVRTGATATTTAQFVLLLQRPVFLQATHIDVDQAKVLLLISCYQDVAWQSGGSDCD